MTQEPFNFDKLDRPGRKRNSELCAEFRTLLTEGFDTNAAMVGTEMLTITKEAGLAITKAWRNELWKAFREIEDRLDPLAALTREKQRNDTARNA